MIIDFIGMPGCGKSFCAKQLENHLLNHGIRVHNMSRDKESTLIYKLIFRVSEKIVKVLPSYKKKANIIKCQVADYVKDQPLYFKNDFCQILHNVLTHLFVHNVFQKGTAVFINDEGILHKLLYLHVHYNIPIACIIDMYNSLGCNPVNIVINNDVDLSYRYIKSRNRHDCAMDELKDNVLLEYLDSFYNGIHTTTLPNTICIDRTTPISQNVEILYKIIFEK